MDELVKAVETLKAAIVKQFGDLPSEISNEFAVIENLITEAAKPAQDAPASGSEAV